MNKINDKYQTRPGNKKAGPRDGIQQPNKWRWRVRARVFDSSEFPVWKFMPFDCDAAIPNNAVL
jgi:hypothetical protein